MESQVSYSPVCLSARQNAVRNHDYYLPHSRIDAAIFLAEALPNEGTSRLIPWNIFLYEKPLSLSRNSMSLRNPKPSGSGHKC